MLQRVPFDESDNFPDFFFFLIAKTKGLSYHVLQLWLH